MSKNIRMILMPNLPHLYWFTMASLAILLIPGPAVFYVIVQSINRGRIAGFAAVLGLELGTLFHVVIAAFSISTLLPASTAVFNLLKCFGAVYLIYLGVQNLMSIKKTQRSNVDSNKSLPKIFWKGILIELLNPKTMLFFFAFLPQFVNSNQGNIAPQILILGFWFVGLATVIDIIYASLAASAGDFLRKESRFIHGQHYVESSVYVGLGIAIALAD